MRNVMGAVMQSEIEIRKTETWGTWTVVIEGKEVGAVRLNVPLGKFEVTIDTAMGYGKVVQKAVDEVERLGTVEQIEAAVRRGYAEHLKVLDRLKVVERESRPRFVSTPMGGQPK
ncbi:hypothetical protein [Streptomyces sp. UNOC14_S4]|uniref:hypothetical protein n=1 Tax=Streptomyces sp. UNOC14_S4 TaxID=2872340 RepID=UPI001E385880|nr:hypothetical protein [Streptomyces sp. UNOC14_S4]MCC3766454.1 hypothetical protein [Streptomyces sp. UNOC14_S4]